jgi:hypothetical protein
VWSDKNAYKTLLKGIVRTREFLGGLDVDGNVIISGVLENSSEFFTGFIHYAEDGPVAGP